MGHQCATAGLVIWYYMDGVNTDKLFEAMEVEFEESSERKSTIQRY